MALPLVAILVSPKWVLQNSQGSVKVTYNTCKYSYFSPFMYAGIIFVSSGTNFLLNFTPV